MLRPRFLASSTSFSMFSYVDSQVLSNRIRPADEVTLSSESVSLRMLFAISTEALLSVRYFFICDIYSAFSSESEEHIMISPAFLPAASVNILLETSASPSLLFFEIEPSIGSLNADLRSFSVLSLGESVYLAANIIRTANAHMNAPSIAYLM